MPIYNTQSPPPAIYPGDQVLLIGTLLTPSTPLASATGETKATGAAATNALSQQIVLAGPWVENNLTSFNLEFTFSANPGAFEFDVMGADTDDNQHYIQIGSNAVTTAALSPVPGSSLYIAILQIVSVKNRLIALFCKTQPANACTVIAKLSR